MKKKCIEIINMKNKKPKYPWDFRIDRTTPVGNPYLMEGGATREDVCREYEKWFNDVLSMQNKTQLHAYLLKMLAAYRQYGKLRLFCWCAPEQCHGETIKAWLESGKE
jgi:hypothetical protein